MKNKGFTKYPNEILEYLATFNLSSAKRRVISVIIRQTYGFHKEWDMISWSQFIKKTNLERKHFGITIKELIQTNIVKRSGKSSYKINPNTNEWLVGKQPPVGITTTKSVKPATENGGEIPTYNINKEIKQKKVLFFDNNRCFFKDNKIFVWVDREAKEWSEHQPERFELRMGNQIIAKGVEALKLYKRTCKNK